MDNKTPLTMPLRHNISLEERRKLTVTGVTDVESFDEQMVLLQTHTGELMIKGRGLHITKIDVATGDLAVEGEVDELSYGDVKPQGGMLSRLFR